MNRDERRALAATYRQVTIRHTCAACGTSLGATFIVEKHDLTPPVTFLHNPDGSHEPIIGGDGIAARARRQNAIIGVAKGELIDD